MRTKISARAISYAKEGAARAELRLFQAVDDGTLFFWGTRRYRRVAIGQGMEGLRRIAAEDVRRKAAQRLRAYRRRGYIKERRLSNRRVLMLTARGKALKLRLELCSAPRRTDRKILIVAFDIPECRSNYRQTLRGMLRRCGFKRLQDSVWYSVTSAERPLRAWIASLHADDWVRLFLAEPL